MSNVKGFRSKPVPTKGQIMQQNATLEQELQNLKVQVNFAGNIATQSMNAIRQLAPEIDALTSLEASAIVDGVAEKGDHVMMDYIGLPLKEDGTPETDENGLPAYHPGMFGLKFCLRNLGGGALIAGFEDAIVGKKAGDTFEVELTFPADYAAKELQGKRAKFLVHVHRVYRALPVSPVEKTMADYQMIKGKILEAKKAEAQKAEATPSEQSAAAEPTAE